MVAKYKDIRPQIKYDRDMWISEGLNRYSTKWKNKKRSWSYLLALIGKPEVTRETYREFLPLPKKEQDSMKDVGGFVAGVLKDGLRNKQTVVSREVVTLDLDSAPVGFWEDFELSTTHACAYYTTHKHSPEKPRLRLLIPLSREVKPDEYEAVARWLASEIGIDYMDPTTFQPSRLMYWPSVASDGEFKSGYIDAPFLDPDEVLANYSDWKDVSQWPTCDGEVKQRERALKKAEDPKSKKGLIGAFCRAYTIQEAIAKFIPEVYEPTDKDDRYTFTAGSSAGGLVIYGDLAYSNHSTDPAGGQALNAFDIVRIHKFDGFLEDVTTPVNRRESYKAMCELAEADKRVRMELRTVKASDFESDAESGDWQEHLSYNANGGLQKSMQNLKLIFDNDPCFNGLAFDELAGKVAVSKVAWDRKGIGEHWTDYDDLAVVEYISLNYADFKDQWLRGQVAIKAQQRRFHPIKRYLESLKWDGVERVDTLLIDLLGAEDNIYTREAMRKALLAAVKRIYEPGSKFDYILVLSGPQGCGKSTLVSMLGGKWYSDSLSFDDMRSKEGYEKLKGYWIFEISELKGMKKTDIESIKSFISSQHDEFRRAYGRNSEQNMRQCVFIGTVNGEGGFLRDLTGNRRFWPVNVNSGGRVFDLPEGYIDQVWAEAYHRYKSGERSLILSPEAEKLADKARAEANEIDDRQGFVEEYLDRKLPVDWESKDISERIDFLESDEEGIIERETVSIPEVWCECFRMRKSDLNRQQSYAIGGILKSLGWISKGRKARLKPYGQVRIYTKEVEE